MQQATSTDMYSFDLQPEHANLDVSMSPTKLIIFNPLLEYRKKIYVALDTKESELFTHSSPRD